MKVRRLTRQLDTPTQAGDGETHPLTHLPPHLPVKVRAQRVAETDRLRRTIASASQTKWAFQTRTDVLRCEVETLGDPQAARFSFVMAVRAWNAYAVVQAALRSPHDEQKIDGEHSDEHFLRAVVLTQTGMDIAVDPAAWEHDRTLPPTRFAQTLERLAQQIDLKRYPKHGPKKPRPQQTSGQKNHHVSTAKLLAKTQLKQTASKIPKQRP